MNNKSLAITITLGLFIYLFIAGLGDALMPLTVAFGLAYLLFPVVKQLESKGLDRHKSVIIVFMLMSLVLLMALVLIIPNLISDAKHFLTELPDNISTSLEKIESLLLNFGIEANLSRAEIVAFLQDNSKKISGGIFKGIGTGLSAILWLLNLFLIPLFFFYLIDDYEKISKGIESLVPKKLKPRLDSYIKLSNEILSGYIRGQLMVAACLAALYAIGLSLVGLKFGLLIGLLAGFISIIPYAGLAIGMAIALSVSLAQFSGFGEVLGIVAVFALVQLLEGFLITPKLVGNRVGLSTFATVLALIIGGNLLGLVGMLAAIPVAAILKFGLSELLSEYQKLEINQN